jgi:hypothetical protein
MSARSTPHFCTRRISVLLHACCNMRIDHRTSDRLPPSRLQSVDCSRESCGIRPQWHQVPFPVVSFCTSAWWSGRVTLEVITTKVEINSRPNPDQTQINRRSNPGQTQTKLRPVSDQAQTKPRPNPLNLAQTQIKPRPNTDQTHIKPTTNPTPTQKTNPCIGQNNFFFFYFLLG